MSTFYYHISGKNFEERESFDPIDDDSEDVSWVHVLAPEDGELESALEQMAVSDVLAEMITDPNPHPEFLVSEGAGCCAFPVQMPGPWDRKYFMFLIHRRRLLTMTRVAIPYIEKFRAKVVARGAESAVNPMAEIIEACGSADRSALQAMRNEVDALALRVEEEPQKISFVDIRKLKHAIVTCGNTCEDQAFCLASMASPAGREISHDSGRISFRESMLTLVRHVDRSFDRLDLRARELEGQLHLTYQKKTEDRLRILTVISAVFSPLTLLAGIYGMNFEVMPELRFPSAYFICLGAMAGIAVWMLVYFHRRGWLAPSR